MTDAKRLSIEARTKELHLAIKRIQHGRSRTNAVKLTIASVAREAGVSTALIHNVYPGIAELIREAQGRSSRAQRDDKIQKIKAERDKLRTLRAELKTAKAKIADLASINEVLSAENETLKALLTAGNVLLLPKSP